jgi:uncharacterized membrane protein
MPPAIATPTPGQPHFPADPIAVLQYGWPCLAAYYVVAAIIIVLVWRRLGVARFSRSPRQRAIAAAILAAVFAPSEVSDFFLFNVPGPAIAGLVPLLFAIALIAVSQPVALLKAPFWGGFVGIIGGYYILPLFVVFIIAYGALSLYARSRDHTAQNA